MEHAWVQLRILESERGERMSFLEVVRGPGHLDRLLVDVAHRPRVVIAQRLLAVPLCPALLAPAACVQALGPRDGRLTSISGSLLQSIS